MMPIMSAFMVLLCESFYDQNHLLYLLIMNENIERDAIVEQLEKVNKELAKQNSVRRIFFVGIIYGVGFFIGSAVLATIALGIFGPYFAQIPWVRHAYEAGTVFRP